MLLNDHSAVVLVCQGLDLGHVHSVMRAIDAARQQLLAAAAWRPLLDELLREEVADCFKAQLATQRHHPASSAQGPAGGSHSLAWHEIQRSRGHHQPAVLAELLRDATAATGRSYTITCHSGGGQPLVLRCEPGNTSIGPILGYVALLRMSLACMKALMPSPSRLHCPS